MYMKLIYIQIDVADDKSICHISNLQTTLTNMTASKAMIYSRPFDEVPVSCPEGTEGFSVLGGRVPYEHWECE